jgi:Zn-dependent protease with chaperone function
MRHSRARLQIARISRGYLGKRTAGKKFIHTLLIVLFALALSISAHADRTPLKPGFNLFSTQQDSEMGQKLSRQVERQVPMLNDARVDKYLNELGRSLDAHVPAGTPDYHFQYKCVNDMAINAFALPGGYIYINRGAIEAADNEAQLAGVLAHETSHVVLRHGTNQASKQYLAENGLNLLSAFLGNGSVGSLMTELTADFTMESVFLKMSRSDEGQADILGTQILYDAGYDPRAMAQFFEKIQAVGKGSKPVEFFSDHPNPDNRIERVNQEVDRLGGPPEGYKTNSREFAEIKHYIHSLPPPPKGNQPRAGGSSAPSGNQGRPETPSQKVQTYQSGPLSLQYPANWRKMGDQGEIAFAPDGGVIDLGNRHSALAYGVEVNLFELQKNTGENPSLDAATSQLLSNLEQANPHMNIARPRHEMRLNGKAALSIFLENDSPVGGRESDWLITASCSDSLFYILAVAPENEFDSYEHAFQSLVDSVKFSCY